MTHSTRTISAQGSRRPNKFPFHITFERSTRTIPAKVFVFHPTLEHSTCTISQHGSSEVVGSKERVLGRIRETCLCVISHSVSEGMCQDVSFVSFLSPCFLFCIFLLCFLFASAVCRSATSTSAAILDAAFLQLHSCHCRCARSRLLCVAGHR